MTTTKTSPRFNKYGTDLDAVTSATYPGMSDDDVVTEYCWKCGGSGHLPGYEHSDGARCWGCMRTGGAHQVRVGDARARARRRATDRDRAAAKHAAKMAAYMADRQAKQDVWIAANPELAAYLRDVVITADTGAVIVDLARSFRGGDTLTDGQTALLRRVIGEAEAKAAMEPLAEGRIVVRGRVLSVKWVDSPFGYNSGAFKMTVELAGGQRVYGTCPSGIDVDRGDDVEFTATVERSRDDHTFGFFKRPTRARVLTAA